jgi:hypothetical protein
MRPTAPTSPDCRALRISVARKLYEQLTEATDDRQRFRLIADAIGVLEERWPDDVARARGLREGELRWQGELRETELRLQKDVEEGRLNVEQVRLLIQKEIEQVGLSFQKAIEQVRLETERVRAEVRSA